MLQVVQNVRNGATQVREVPDPIAVPGHVVVANLASLISAGTERYVVDLARKSLIGKALERPDHVKRVLEKIRQEGLLLTAQQMRAKLEEPMPLGYSSAGVVLQTGHGVQEFRPGDRVAIAAPHAGVVCMGRNLCARLPQNVGYEQGAFAAVGAIALQGVRQAQVSIGERVLVIGLGLIGQMSVAMLKAQGCQVFGTDIESWKLDIARALGCDEVGVGAPIDAVKRFSEGFGVDAVIITASTQSNEPIEFAAEACRRRGRVVLVGVAGLNLPRPPFYAKELEFTVSSSLGPGRGDPVYEDKGIDYPIGHARWTAQRNMQAVLDMISRGSLPVDKLITHRFPIEKAADAYDVVTARQDHFLGMVIEYPMPKQVARRVVQPTSRPVVDQTLGLSVIGAGNFTQLMLVPTLARLSKVALRGVCSARGLNATQLASRFHFDYASSDVDDVFSDPQTHAVLITTRHDLHADLVVRALRAGKHVFVEKPLCIRESELETIAATVAELGAQCPVLMVGFNRRFAAATHTLKDHFGDAAPLSVAFRFATGEIPLNSWVQDEDVGGGRIVGEACHAIDMCVALTGSAPTKVFAASARPSGEAQRQETGDDKVFITMQHENGSLSQVCYQAGADKGGPRERIEVFGGGRTGICENWSEVELWQRGKAKHLKTGHDKGHREELVRFVEACRTDGKWPISWADLYSTTWASLAAVKALREGMPIER